MRLMAVIAAFAVGAVAIGIASPADAAPRKKKQVVQEPVVEAQPNWGPGATTIISRDEMGRTRTKILVQTRSYLDGGTEERNGEEGEALRTGEPQEEGRDSTAREADEDREGA